MLVHHDNIRDSLSWSGSGKSALGSGSHDNTKKMNIIQALSNHFTAFGSTHPTVGNPDVMCYGESTFSIDGE
jgi:hypothetical protein